MALTLDQLLIIKTAAECGSFSAAARRLGKAQSTVSSTICNIEWEAGVVLFERGSKFLALTSVGQDLLKHINNIISQANNLEGKLNACAAEIEDNLSIIIDPAIPYTLVAPTVRAFCEQFPYVNLHRTYALTALIKDGLSQSLPSEKLLMKSQIASLSASFLTR
ncbi:LysR family transcriptional regulator [Endozoicomonas sp.]|uniref:LysR family transcriptional regulator n=1 Tax=Endozoicomonas sp. TaxID=1892382 RepID=UPI003AF488B9